MSLTINLGMSYEGKLKETNTKVGIKKKKAKPQMFKSFAVKVPSFQTGMGHYGTHLCPHTSFHS